MSRRPRSYLRPMLLRPEARAQDMREAQPESPPESSPDDEPGILWEAFRAAEPPA